MHTFVEVAVSECEDATAASNRADSWFYDVDWSDWFEIGGRWDGAIPDNAVQIGTNRVFCEQLLAGLVAGQKSNAASLATQLLGTTTQAQDIETFGLAVPDEAMVARVAESNAKTAKQYRNILTRCVDKTYDNRGENFLVGMTLRSLGDYLTNTFTPDSGFVDTGEWNANPTFLLDQVLAGQADDVWLVGIDAHF